MRTLLTVVIFSFYSSLGLAQDSLVIGKSDSLSYQTYYDNEQIDSTVFISYKGEFLVCQPFKVYFDEDFKTLAFESFTKGDTCKTIDFWRNGVVKK